MPILGASPEETAEIMGLIDEVTAVFNRRKAQPGIVLTALTTIIKAIEMQTGIKVEAYLIDKGGPVN